MQRQEMVERTKKLALRIIRLVAKLPKSDVGRVIAGQLLRSGTSIGANYREAARSATKSTLRPFSSQRCEKLMRLYTGWSCLPNRTRLNQRCCQN
jgi:four helix bundle protein